MLWRKIEEKLERFRALNGKKALLLTGARQVGKTYSIRQFAKRHYKSFVEINFIRDTVANTNTPVPQHIAARRYGASPVFVVARQRP